MIVLDRNLHGEIYLKYVYAFIYNFLFCILSPNFSVLIAFLSVSMQYLYIMHASRLLLYWGEVNETFLHAWDEMIAEFHVCLLRILD